MLKSRKCIVAIRKTENREWPDTRTLSRFMEVSRDYANQEDKDCGPAWVKDNPIVRFATVEIIEA